MAQKYQPVLSAILKGDFAPVYLLFGEEEFFINKLVNALEDKVLAGADRSFNLDAVYGNEIKGGQLVGLARAFPVMAQRRLVIAREAHRIRKNELDAVVPYLQQPNPQTVLVFIWNNRSGPDKRTSFGKTLHKTATVVESKPLYDNQVPKFVEEIAGALQLKLSPKAVGLVATALGTNLSLIESELRKIQLFLKGQNQAVVDEDLVADFINIDKQFNAFELMDVLGRRQPQALVIIAHMMQNTKDNPPIMLTSQLFGYFSRLYLCHNQKARTQDQIAKVLGMNPFIAKQYIGALQQYSPQQIRQCLRILLEADLHLKGIRSTGMPDAHLMRQTVWQLLHA